MALEYEVVKDMLIVKNSPRVLTNEMLEEINASNYKFIHLCEGIEEIGEGAFYNYTNLQNIVLPSSLKFINNRAFGWCENLEKIVLNEGVILIGKEAFKDCISLNDVILPLSLKKIDRGAFSCCIDLDNICLPDDLKCIGENAFERCGKLSRINIVDGIKEIKRRTFYGCSRLKEVYIPDSVKSIGISAFENCYELERVNGCLNVEKFNDSAFYDCKCLADINLGSNLKEIGARCFSFNISINSLCIPDSVNRIGEEAFYECTRLTDIKLPNNLKILEKGLFCKCLSLEKIDLPDKVKNIEADCFKLCSTLGYVSLPKELESIGEEAFVCCDSLSEITIPYKVDSLKSCLFMASGLKKISFSNNINNFCFTAFLFAKNIENIEIYSEDNSVLINFKNCKLLNNDDNKFFIFDKERKKYGFLNNGKFMEFDERILLDNDKIIKVANDNYYDIGMFIRLYYYSKKKFIPSSTVIKNMPLNDIDKFYVNNNNKEWAKLIKACSDIDSNETKSSFFKLCYVLGLFSESSNARSKAIDFLNDRVVNKLSGFNIHNKFDGFDLSNGFNEEYANFFMKYFDGMDFMLVKNEDGYYVDLTCAGYNNFKNVKLIYPNKLLNTNRKNDILLVEHVIDAVKSIWYNNIGDNNVNFAKVIGRYGYSQEHFEKLQRFYNEGKKLSSEDLKLFISEDDMNNIINYKLLSKDDPLGAVLGNITNCCQVVGGNGEECVRYGMTMPNSSFITFNLKEKIIGQAWVWYDEDSKLICLDNIEVPNKYCDKINNNEIIREEFIKCLLRIQNNFKKEMKIRGFVVDKVTIGKGHNDIVKLLDEYFPLVQFANYLSEYNGYTDALEQYEISNKKKMNNIIK